MLIKINSDDLLDEQLTPLQEHFGVGTASKACMFAATSLLPTQIALDNALRRITELERVICSVLNNRSEIADRERDIESLLDSVNL